MFGATIFCVLVWITLLVYLWSIVGVNYSLCGPHYIPYFACIDFDYQWSFRFDVTEDMCYALHINIVSSRVNGLQTVTLCLNIQSNILKSTLWSILYNILHRTLFVLLFNHTTPSMVFSVTCIIVSPKLFWGIS
jgi:hypothetical protein